MDFGYALTIIRGGGRMTRAEWNNGHSVSLWMPHANSFATQPYLYIETVAGDRIPWTPSQTDVLAYDWEPG